MSVLVVGLSHKSAPVAILEQAVVSGDTLAKLLRDVALTDPVAETFVVSTCNRVEVYADVDRFHAGVTAICELLARHCGVQARDLTAHLYVHYEDRAVAHLLAVACGLDSVVVGEGQILGQVRSALKLAEEQRTIGRVLGELGRLALRAGKRARTETGIDRAGQSLVSVAIELAAARLGDAAPEPGAPGAGRAARTRGRRRRDEHARGHHGRPERRGEHRGGEPDPPPRGAPGREGGRCGGRARRPGPALAGADLVISCTGADGHVITRDLVSAALAAGPEARAARWWSSTWPCRATWNRPWPRCPAWW